MLAFLRLQQDRFELRGTVLDRCDSHCGTLLSEDTFGLKMCDQRDGKNGKISVPRERYGLMRLGFEDGCRGLLKGLKGIGFQIARVFYLGNDS